MKTMGCILAGGAGRRLGGRNKGLMLWHGQTLLERVLARFQDQVDELCLSVHVPPHPFADWGYPVLCDCPEFQSVHHGPLAGIERALNHALQQGCQRLAVVPCDAPLLPTGLVARLTNSCLTRSAVVAHATFRDQDQPLFALIDTNLHSGLVEWLGRGNFKVTAWYDRWNRLRVPFEEDHRAFANFNTPADFARSLDSSEDSHAN